MKKYLVWGILILILIGFVNAQAVRKIYFYDEPNSAVTYVLIMGWQCGHRFISLF
jgi:hypothetical protein